MSAVGFDIGNENCYIAVNKCGECEVLRNEYGIPHTPTYILFSDRSREIGLPAKIRLLNNFNNTVFGFKNLLGLNYKCTKDEVSYLTYRICEMPSGEVGVKLHYLRNETVFSVVQLMAMILTELKSVSETKLDTKIRDVVISVPAYFTDAARRAMLSAAKIAGVNALKLINESTAVALAYGYYQRDLTNVQPKNVIFIDFGSSSLTVTACAFSKNMLKILGCVWDRVGGRDFNKLLANYFFYKNKNQYATHVRSNPRAFLEFILDCEIMKKRLSESSDDPSLMIDYVTRGTYLKEKMDRNSFDTISMGLLDQIKTTLKRILHETELGLADIHSVELVGGSCRLPCFRMLVKEVFDKDPSTTLNPDEAVSRGCALQCALLSSSLLTRSFSVEDKLSYSLKVRWKNKDLKYEEKEVFSRSEPLPSDKVIALCMSKPFEMTAFHIDDFLLSKRNIIRKFSFYLSEDIDCETGNVKLRFIVDTNGIFSVSSAEMVRSEERFLDLNDTSMELSTSGKAAVEAVQNTDPSNAKFYNLSVVFEDTLLQADTPNEFMRLEQQMINVNLSEKQNKDARDALEDFLFTMDSKLNGEYEEFVKSGDKQVLNELLRTFEDWLDDNEHQESGEYNVRLLELQNNFKPLMQRHYEWNERPVVVNEYLKMLQELSDTISLGAHKAVVDEDEINKLYEIYRNSDRYLKDYMETVSPLEKHVNPPVSVESLRKKMYEFSLIFKDLFTKVQNVVKSSEYLRNSDVFVAKTSAKNEEPSTEYTPSDIDID